MTDFTIYTVDLDTQRPNPTDNTKVLRGDPPRTAFSKYNDLLLALQGAVPHVGIEAPNPTVPFMKWFDTSVSPPVERYRNSANTAWLLANPLATTTSDGWMSKADKAKLDGVQTNAYLLNRANHTGTQAISTITGLQAALDAKSPLASPVFTGVPIAPTPAVGTNTAQVQTAAGALAQMQAFGLGNTAGVTIPSLETHRTSGAFLADAAVSTAGGLPLSLQHIITYRPGTSTANGEMWATPLTTAAANGKRVWFRKLNSSVWQPWVEIASLDSPLFTGSPVTPNLKFGNAASSDVNTLDYYEEGVFTPTLISTGTTGNVTYGSRGGTYTRIGDRVFWSLLLTLSGLGGTTGGLRIGGLPYIVTGGTASNGGASVGFFSAMAATNITGLFVMPVSSASELALYKTTTSAATGASTLVHTDVSDTFQIRVSGLYKAV